MEETQQPKRWDIFLSSVFFVLGFSVIFSLLGVLLQTVLSSVGYTVQIWLGRIGGTIIILFGLFLLHLIKIPFLERQHTFRVTHKFKSHYITSFVFGAAFAVGWTPCVGAALGAILALAATQSASAFVLLMTYTLGLGIPFLIVGLFAQKASQWIEHAQSWLKYVQYGFGVILIAMGVLVFTGQLARVANLEFLVNMFGTDMTSSGSITSLSFFSIGLAFIAGLTSFLSPCVLPLIPGFLSYLASTTVKKHEK